MSKVNTILEDKRIIARLDYEDGVTYGVGMQLHSNMETITKIVAYPEPAQYCNVPYFAVYSELGIELRIPATHVAVIYET